MQLSTIFTNQQFHTILAMMIVTEDYLVLKDNANFLMQISWTDKTTSANCVNICKKFTRFLVITITNVGWNFQENWKVKIECSLLLFIHYCKLLHILCCTQNKFQFLTYYINILCTFLSATHLQLFNAMSVPQISHKGINDVLWD